MHLDIILLGIEATIGQQALIHTTQLVHTQVGVADAPTVILLLRERQGSNNFLPLDIADAYLAQLFKVLVIKQG